MLLLGGVVRVRVVLGRVSVSVTLVVMRVWVSGGWGGRAMLALGSGGKLRSPLKVWDCGKFVSGGVLCCGE